MKSWFTVYFCSILIFKTDEMTLRKSSGVAVRAGDSVEIECQPLPSNDCSDCRLLEWSFTPAVVDAFDPLTLFNPEKGVHVNFSKRVSVSDRRSLKLSTVTPDDAGFFQCVLFCLLSSGIQGTCKDESELTVLLYLNCSPLLLLDSVAEGQNITLNCVIGYKGNWVPSLEWKTEEEGEGGEGGGKEKAIGNNLEYQASVPSSTVNFTFNLITKSSMHGKKIGFKVYFDEKDYVGEMNRTSIDPPKSTHRWSSSTLNIFYPPRNLKISADQGFYAGSVFTCSADANPEPGFRWKVLETGATFDRQTIRLLEEQLAGYSTVHLTCTAANQIANISRSIAVQKRESNQMKSSLIAVIVISCVLLILLTIAVSYILYLKRKGEGHRMATEATGPASPPIPPVDQSPVPNNSESNSYTSVPSEVLSPEQETEISALYVQHLTSDSAEQLEGYAQLEAREQPAPNVYSRLKSVSSTRQLDSFADSGYYVNVTAS